MSDLIAGRDGAWSPRTRKERTDMTDLRGAVTPAQQEQHAHCSSNCSCGKHRTWTEQRREALAEAARQRARLRKVAQPEVIINGIGRPGLH